MLVAMAESKGTMMVTFLFQFIYLRNGSFDVSSARLFDCANRFIANLQETIWAIRSRQLRLQLESFALGHTCIQIHRAYTCIYNTRDRWTHTRSHTHIHTHKAQSTYTSTYTKHTHSHTQKEHTKYTHTKHTQSIEKHTHTKHITHTTHT